MGEGGHISSANPCSYSVGLTATSPQRVQSTGGLSRRRSLCVMSASQPLSCSPASPMPCLTSLQPGNYVLQGLRPCFSLCAGPPDVLTGGSSHHPSAQPCWSTRLPSLIPMALAPDPCGHRLWEVSLSEAFFFSIRGTGLLPEYPQGTQIACRGCSFCSSWVRRRP